MPISQEVPVPQDINARVLSFLIMQETVDPRAGSILNTGNLQDLVNWTTEAGNQEVILVRPDKLAEKSSDHLLQLLDCLSYLRGEISVGRIKEPAVKVGEVFGKKLEEAVWNILERNAGYPRDKAVDVLGDYGEVQKRLKEYYIEGKTNVYTALSAKISGKQPAVKPELSVKSPDQSIREAGYDEEQFRLNDGTYQQFMNGRFMGENKGEKVVLKGVRELDAFVHWLLKNGKLQFNVGGNRVFLPGVNQDETAFLNNLLEIRREEAGNEMGNYDIHGQFSHLELAVQRVLFAAEHTQKELKNDLGGYLHYKSLFEKPSFV